MQREYYNQPQSLVLLIQVATGHEDPNLRQLAAVESRSLVTKHWVKVQADQKPQIREQLVRSTLGEGSSLVRHSVARIISAIAKIDLNDGEWADLPNFLIQAAGSGNKDERVVGTYILFTILETLGEGFEAKFQELFNLFSNTIRDPESEEVRINTLLALSKLAMHLDSEENEAPVKAFQEFIPPMVAILKEAIDNQQEDRVMQAFEVFQTLLGCDPALLTPHLKDLVIFMNELAANTDADEDTRTQAISFLMQSVQYRKLKIQGMRLGEQLTRSALQIVTELSDSPCNKENCKSRLRILYTKHAEKKRTDSRCRRPEETAKSMGLSISSCGLVNDRLEVGSSSSCLIKQRLGDSHIGLHVVLRLKLCLDRFKL